MTGKPVFIAMVAVFLLASTGTKALADVAPPDGYKEDCTLEKVHYNDLECVECEGLGAPNPEVEDCESRYSPNGFTKNCRTWGGSVWTEIWCKDSPGTIGPAGDEGADDSACAVGKIGTNTQAIPVALLLCLLTVGLGIRRRLKK